MSTRKLESHLNTYTIFPAHFYFVSVITKLAGNTYLSKIRQRIRHQCLQNPYVLNKYHVSYRPIYHITVKNNYLNFIY